ncbi:MAG: internal scaffolding protein [Microvirus sp.]|nr:MAG: internal scaffolding protein [Microvirus sp.]
MTHHPNSNPQPQISTVKNLPLSNHHSLIRDYQTPRVRRGIIFASQGRTKQEFASECDINNIMRRYLKTGIIDHVRDSAPQYLDATAFEFQSAMELVAQAQTIFEELPSSIRTRFENDPARLLEFVHDPDNVAEAVAMGFLDPAKLPPPNEAPKAAPAASQPPTTTPPETTGGKGA